jgi:hypothetical protein
MLAKSSGEAIDELAVDGLADFSSWGLASRTGGLQILRILNGKLIMMEPRLEIGPGIAEIKALADKIECACRWMRSS